MKYRKDRYGNEISVLGFGCMRFAKKGNAIDMEKTEEQIDYAISQGINYFDTAYVYSGSEAALGEILSRNGRREKVNIATKLPQYLISREGMIEKLFQEELKRLRTDHVDYYLMHMLTDLSAWQNLVNHGVEDWIREKKASGEIRNIGFSFHGNTEMFLKILNAYDWDFCQIQYNYMDEHSQAGRRGLQAANEKGIPVMIMEPLRGGKLVDLLPEKAKKLIAGNDRFGSPAELAFRWLWSQPEITCVLSGMNSLEMVKENCRIASASEVGDLKEEDYALIEEVKTLINEKIKVPCTGCGYCQPCPQGVDIPLAFRCYNEMYMESKQAGRFEYAQTVGLREKPAFPSQCVACGKCESHCPQHIAIIQELKNADRNLRPLPYKIGTAIARKFLLKKKKG
ncbi:MAG: aldo/keto reductase [Erysipelotrichaceae bacterium]|nr:aldo/keto reductase [Erysipelotrichaceae bacterium]